MEATYRAAVHRLLEGIKHGEAYNVKDLAPNSPIDFIEACKEYIDAWPWGGYIEFNSDYSVIRKIQPIIEDENSQKRIAEANRAPIIIASI